MDGEIVVRYARIHLQYTPHRAPQHWPRLRVGPGGDEVIHASKTLCGVPSGYGQKACEGVGSRTAAGSGRGRDSLIVGRLVVVTLAPSEAALVSKDGRNVYQSLEGWILREDSVARELCWDSEDFLVADTTLL